MLAQCHRVCEDILTKVGIAAAQLKNKNSDLAFLYDPSLSVSSNKSKLAPATWSRRAPQKNCKNTALGACSSPARPAATFRPLNFALIQPVRVKVNRCFESLRHFCSVFRGSVTLYNILSSHSRMIWRSRATLS